MSRDTLILPIYNLAISSGANYALYGFMVCCVLFGIALGQTIYYYRNYTGDYRYIKIYVAFCMLLEATRFCSLAETLNYWMTICKMPENYAKAFIFRPSYLDSFFITSLIAILVHLFYAFRIWHLSQNNVYVTGLIMLLAIITYVFANVINVYLVLHRSLDTIHSHFSLITYSGNLAGAALTETIITIVSIYYLHSRRTGFTATENVIDRLIVFSANIGLIMCVNVIINLVLLLALSDSYLIATWQLFIGILYVNSMLMALNWRRSFRKTMNRSTDIRLPEASTTDTRLYYDDTHTIIAVEPETDKDEDIPLSTVISNPSSSNSTVDSRSRLALEAE